MSLPNTTGAHRWALSAIPAMVALMQPPLANALPPHLLIDRGYEVTATLRTFDQGDSVLQDGARFATDELEEVVARVYAQLLAAQAPLQEEFERVLHDNLWELYER